MRGFAPPVVVFLGAEHKRRGRVSLTLGALAFAFPRLGGLENRPASFPRSGRPSEERAAGPPPFQFLLRAKPPRFPEYLGNPARPIPAGSFLSAAAFSVARNSPGLGDCGLSISLRPGVRVERRAVCLPNPPNGGLAPRLGLACGALRFSPLLGGLGAVRAAGLFGSPFPPRAGASSPTAGSCVLQRSLLVVLLREGLAFSPTSLRSPGPVLAPGDNGRPEIANPSRDAVRWFVVPWRLFFSSALSVSSVGHLPGVFPEVLSFQSAFRRRRCYICGLSFAGGGAALSDRGGLPSPAPQKARPAVSPFGPHPPRPPEGLAVPWGFAGSVACGCALGVGGL
ncbi:hypothetical protein AGDE_14889 [Angomonas deanei]|uniref:Uncharacterized protein n=1 Tax=Angomonas deanei TaxID=59799 RepID=A0A7G2CGJ0_9TRYP|nr:hypothetical protein AGDE_14889 [Angomonas deanei]CAD2218475.1 hypothetical protein, conserved [Angomonas deanei]|eukprot:EPY20042.1 hypothetical protein AGDE_14889 [Angomonas deanei]